LRFFNRVYLKLGFKSFNIYKDYRLGKRVREMLGGRFRMEKESKILQSVMMSWRDAKDEKKHRGEKIANVIERVIMLKNGFYSLR
jgi:hypothetical protein